MIYKVNVNVESNYVNSNGKQMAELFIKGLQTHFKLDL